MHLIAFCCPLPSHLLSLNLRSSRSPYKLPRWKAVRVISIKYLKLKVFGWEYIYIFYIYICINFIYAYLWLRAVDTLFEQLHVIANLTIIMKFDAFMLWPWKPFCVECSKRVSFPSIWRSSAFAAFVWVTHIVCEWISESLSAGIGASMWITTLMTTIRSIARSMFRMSHVCVASRRNFSKITTNSIQ